MEVTITTTSAWPPNSAGIRIFALIGTVAPQLFPDAGTPCTTGDRARALQPPSAGSGDHQLQQPEAAPNTPSGSAMAAAATRMPRHRRLIIATIR
jgi:hypothetical protein